MEFPPPLFILFYENTIKLRPVCKESRKSENINQVGKYDKMGGKYGKRDLKNLKLRSDVSNEILD